MNGKLLPIKLHFFLFMGALGPILPQLPLFGKDLGISVDVMGIITGILPFTFLLMKPVFGLLIDVFRQYRKTIFVMLILVMTLSFGGFYFILPKSASSMTIGSNKNDCYRFNDTFFVINSSKSKFLDCINCATLTNRSGFNKTKCTFGVQESTNSSGQDFYRSFTFWTFVIFMSVGTIGFNVVNSLSDAICFDIIEDNENYGSQRLWGSIGFGITGLLSGYLTDFFSTSFHNYTPAFTIMVIFSAADMIVCSKLELPVIEAPKSIFKDLKVLLSDKHVFTFAIFTVMAGILDSLIVYFLFWYIEDLASQTHTDNIKLVEGLILAAETLGAEVIFFSISGKVLKRLGHVHSFTLCFLNYFLRLAVVVVVPSPWWFLPIEFLMQGPTFALTYATIVAYANELAPLGLSATMQGIASGMADGTGYALGSVTGGLCYRSLGGKITFELFAALGFFCVLLHYTLHQTVLKRRQIHRSHYESLP